ncbi:MAG: heparinase II/III family protein, partial [Candidatus Eiseniibacteriota bacterium]
MPDRLHAVPPDPWPTNVARAEAIVGGADPLNGVMAQHGPIHPESFDWLRDLGHLATDDARKAACYFVRHWIEHHGRDHTEAQQVDVLAERLVNWIGQYPFLNDGAEHGFRTTFADGLMRQVAELERSAKRAPQGLKRLAAAKALLYAGVCLPRAEKRVARGLALLEPELGRLVLPDGGSCDRNPSSQLAILKHLVDIRGVLIAGHVDVPEYLQNAIDRTAPLLRFFRHGDGRLALFNGGIEETAALIDLVLAEAKAEGKAPANAPHAGFQRLNAGDTTVIVDCGRPPPPVVAPDAHAGTLSFELSSGGARLVVNCGTASETAGLWRQLMRTTAAHSTLAVKDTNSSELLQEGGVGRRPDDVACRRNSAQGATW